VGLFLTCIALLKESHDSKIVLVVLCLLIIPITIRAQSATASLRGVVTDTTKAVVPDAEVTITSIGTAQQHVERTDSRGEFSFQELFIGDYRVEVRSPGFAVWADSRIHLDVGNQSQIAVQLVPAATQQTIEVTAEAAGLQTNEMAQGAVVSESEIANLPLNGRNFSQLGILQPGVRPTSSGLTVQNTFRRIGQNYEVNGMRPESNTFLVDGMRNINRMDGGYAYRPPADSMAEFRILTTTAPAEFGGTDGGITTIVTRSERIRSTERCTSSCATMRSMPTTTSRHRKKSSSRTSTAAPSAVPWCITAPTSSRTTKVCAKIRTSRMAWWCRRWRSAVATSRQMRLFS